MPCRNVTHETEKKKQKTKGFDVERTSIPVQTTTALTARRPLPVAARFKKILSNATTTSYALALFLHCLLTPACGRSSIQQQCTLDIRM